MAGTVNNPAAPRSERRTQNHVVGLFRDALGYRDRRQALSGGGEIPPQPLRLGGAPQMKGASPRYAVTSPRGKCRPGSGDMQAAAIPGKPTSRLQRYRLTEKGKALAGRQNT